MDVFDLRNRVIDDYARYVRSFITIADGRIGAAVDRELEGGALWPQPLLQLNPAFEPGEALEALVARGVLHRDCLRIFRRKPTPDTDLGLLTLHRHQVESIEAARAGDNYVLTTGTGSGKSLAYIVPIVDHVLRRGSGRGIQAIVVYPMNALANSQEGELEKFLKHGFPEGPPVTFRRYTGQESSAERNEIISRPPDILLTNYVMLELVLTRPRERDLVRAAHGLRFLVLDELHTYRGRQGADVAMLVRRVREACQTTDVIHVGTSATLRPSEGTWSDARREVADVASRLFGVPVLPERVIGETLRRTTAPFRASDRPALRARVEGTSPAPVDLGRFRRDSLSSWIESTLGLTEEEGRLVRTEPRPLRGDDGAVAALAAETGQPPATCESALRSALLLGNRLRDESGRPALAFRLHQFISKGESVYATLEPEIRRHITLQAQHFAPDSNRGRILLPLAFCRECGREYYVVRRREGDEGSIAYHARELSDRRHGPEGDAGFLYVDTRDPWPSHQDTNGIVERLPDSWLELDPRQDRMRVREARRDRLPREVHVDPLGVERPGGIRAHWIRAPFLLCLTCLVDYDPHQRSDYGKLATLGSEGRSTATTVLSLSIVRELRGDESLDAEARKLLSFTDNRQDASLQAGHFNDFVEVSLIRAALWRAAQDAGTEGIRHEDLTRRVFDALALPLSSYARNPEVRYRALDETRRALRQVLGHYLYRDLRRGWRVTSPNLEQCGLLEIDYLCLDELARDDAEWAALHPALATARPDHREAACRVLLDYLRRELAIQVDVLEPDHHERLKSLSDQYLEEPWAVDADEDLQRGRIALPPTTASRRAPTRAALYLSERGGFGLFLKRRTTFPDHATGLSMDDARSIITELLEILVRPDILARVPLGHGDSAPVGYQLKASAIIWRASDGTSAFHDPVRVPNAPVEGLRTNRFFGALYRGDTSRLRDLEAREHTAQVPALDRIEREKRFRTAELPILFCSPTMELGVDIAQLNVVHLRNVPPTPANYAQRSGRAGRSGQPALVTAYCSSGSPHDQYFFRRPARMVSGTVTPPRLELANEDLLRAHVHAIWASTADLDLHESLREVLDVDTDTPTLAVRTEVAARLSDIRARDSALSRAREACGPAVAILLESMGDERGDVDAWLRSVLDRIPTSFEEACDRWRGLYRSALEQAKRQQRIILDSSRAPDDRKRAERLAAEAVSQLDLLLDRAGTQNSDFYSYRYFASEGFLPGYNFPRLPLSAYLPGRKRIRGVPNFVSRPRFLAITEFGPRSFIYHEGSRYQISKVILPVEGEDRSFTRRAAQCARCGYLHPLADEPAPDLCERCATRLPLPTENLFRMQNVATKRADRINSDEEERLRLGYEVRTGIRFAERDGTRLVRIAVLRGEDGEPLARLHYGHAATIWRINLGERRRQNRDRLGYTLDLERGLWVSDPGDDDAPTPQDGDAAPQRDEAPSRRTALVIPFVEDSRNCLIIEPVQPLLPEVMASLQAALKSALQVYFQLEDNELAAEALPTEIDRRLILLYEASEGGAGALRRLVDTRERRALPEVARIALELCHFDPDARDPVDLGPLDLGQNPRARERCVAACYDCLLSYYNQRDHRILDRLKIRGLLDRWRGGTVDIETSSRSRDETLAGLGASASDACRRWLRAIDRLGLRPPTEAGVALAGVRVDFLYRAEGCGVFIEAPLSTDDEERLSDAGITAVRFGPNEAAWDGIFARFPNVFGAPRAAPSGAPTGGAVPPGGRSSAGSPGGDAVPPATGFDPDLFERRWHPLLQRLVSTPGVLVDGGMDVSMSGRVVGTTVALVRTSASAVQLVDDADAAADAICAALHAGGERSVRARAEAPTSLAAILRALEGRS